MTQKILLSISPKEASSQEGILRQIQKQNPFNGVEAKSYHIIKRSIDARKKDIKINLQLLVSDEEQIDIPTPLQRTYKNPGPDAKEVIIVGAGPAGLFAALKAIELGLRPIVVERGYDVDTRRKDIALLSRENKISENSNFCFGEGGAGTFSDGKLFTRSKKRGNNREVLEILHQFGADPDILIDSHPHIGTDKLGGIIKNIREKIIKCGGEVRFGMKMEKILLSGDKATGIELSDGSKLYGPVFLATGHSARDTYRALHNQGIKLEPKGLAVGVRLEHPQTLIDRMQYHNPNGRGQYLPPAEYNFVEQSEGRGVYSFCMCPGGVIVPAISGKNQIVVNGMSASARGSRWANSGFVVELHPGDIPTLEDSHPFEMLGVQERLERKFSEESRGMLNAPAQKISDFLEGKVSDTLPATSYVPGIYSSDFNKLFPVQISRRLKDGLKKIGNKCKEFVSDQGIMLGLESRTSSPIRIPRDREELCHVEIKDLYPMGEGAGYAGGIVSSAVDGIRCIEAYHKEITGDGNNT